MAKKTPFEKFVMQMKQQANMHRTPLIGHFELTARCNLDCKMCFVHEKDCEQIRVRELSTQQWIRIMDDAYDAGMLFALLTGGECLLRHDFKELYLHLWNKGVHVSVNTNAVMLSEEYVAFFKKYPPQQIQISLYGSSDESYEVVSGMRAFSRVSKALMLLQEAALPFTVAVTPSKYMKEEFEHIIRYLIDHRFKHTVNPATLPPRDGLVRENYHLTEDEYFELLHRYYDQLGIERIPVAEAALPPTGGGTERAACCASPCNAGNINVSVNWKGEMVPCLASPSHSVDLLTVDYVTAWEQIKAFTREQFYAIECNGCPYTAVCPRCPAVRLDENRPGHCNLSLCSQTRRKCAEGFIKFPTSTPNASL